MVKAAFGEREAIQSRLQQIDQTEREIKRHFDQERKQLELRLAMIGLPNAKKRAGSVKERRRSAYVDYLQEVIVAYLKEEKRPVRGFAIQQFVEDQTGHHIGNMSAFMNTLMPKHQEVRKLGRGMYVYEETVLSRVQGQVK
ncbi:hypothetical protein RRU94_10300 [Domibacillus sp. DTU_2020_1001157_1_SI_ALB_TIR_016]|uniref:Rok-like winged helix domain-containing protein n=1 Tax=Domibacillus sp. DTU_2020_1001157_1_SI_ALB_TIR_016 TaxID=3077789 RepID=UPI0028E74E98|nr:hypothetical protein [Domibacillus sp. DTU_2020_1001157_1_SI_ALB_TIR_016]WNS81193.1 hypothetical protein RRU94_10300 [Domibacillus sp. DTU_2020_1001157_1_SI_ALB_TIR_016]